MKEVLRLNGYTCSVQIICGVVGPGEDAVKLSELEHPTSIGLTLKGPKQQLQQTTF